MRTMRPVSLLALCGVLAIGTPEALAKKGGKGNKHQGGVVGLPPGHGGIPPGHGGIPPGRAKKRYGYAASSIYPTPVSGGYDYQRYSQEGSIEQGGGYASYWDGTYGGGAPGGPGSYPQPSREGGGRADFSGTLIWQSQGYPPTYPDP